MQDQSICFGDWWNHLNIELGNLGESQALYNDARYYHTAGYWPSTAARLIAEERKSE